MDCNEALSAARGMLDLYDCPVISGDYGREAISTLIDEVVKLSNAIEGESAVYQIGFEDGYREGYDQGYYDGHDPEFT